MNIFANTVVTLTFELYDADGVLLESTDEPITYLHGGHSGMLPKLEEALNCKKAGDAVSVDVEPEDGFGDYDPELVKLETADRLPPEIEVGMQFEAHTSADDEHGSGTVFTVTDIADGKVVLDGNHPWAGKRLRFDCQILDVRPATAEEVAARPRARRGRPPSLTHPVRPVKRSSSFLSSYSAASASRGVIASGSSAASLRCDRLPSRRVAAVCSEVALSRDDAEGREQIGLRAVRRVELVEAREVIPRAADHGRGHARELRHLQSVAAVGGAVLRGVQEDDAVGMLDRVEMQVRAAVDLGGQRRQLEIVRREEREAAVLLREFARDRPGERQAVERGRAAADLVDQHEALRRRAVQDRRRFGHLDHERRAAAGEIVGGADARVDRVERADRRRVAPARTSRSRRGARSPPPAACTSTCRPCSGR